ncbi:mechanosensitive ion channel [candidate division KSB1 bacterium]|nr:mechanosensitive ion channel [candidate division KSB1 bacterium]
MDFIKDLFQNIPRWISVTFLLILVVFVFYIFIHYFFKKRFLKIKFLISEIIVPFEMLVKPMQFLFPPICFLIIIPFLSAAANIENLLNHIFTIWLIIGIAWLIIRIFMILKTIILNQYKLDVKDNLVARQINTQLNIIQRVLVVIVFVLAASAILMTFEKVKEIGLSILASAGITGIIIGFAAQRSLANLIAGIQIAITQPIRIEDAVVVQNEMGWIEEITLTYVVIRIWDQRRLIVPVNYFIEHPFHNWTRTTSELLGAIYIYADYGIPIDELRRELERIVNASPLWDKRIAKIQITNATEKAIEMRALISAENSSNTWELRCLVREKLIDFIQRNYPEKLPRIRLETNKEDNNVFD